MLRLGRQFLFVLSLTTLGVLTVEANILIQLPRELRPGLKSARRLVRKIKLILKLLSFIVTCIVLPRITNKYSTIIAIHTAVQYNHLS